MIKIYSKVGCEQCKLAKDCMRRNNIDFESIDLSKKENREARKYYRNLGIKTLPVITNDEENWILPEWDEDMFLILIGTHG